MLRKIVLYSTTHCAQHLSSMYTQSHLLKLPDDCGLIFTMIPQSTAQLFYCHHDNQLPHNAIKHGKAK